MSLARSKRWFTGALLAALTVAPAPSADAAEPRLVRAVLLRVADRISLALEMTAEPERASLRVLSGTVVEVEAGPVSGRIMDDQLAPSVNTFVRQVSLHKYTAPNRLSFLRARVMLDAPAGSNVRVVGRTIYLDLAPTSLSRAVVPVFQPPARQEPSQAQAISQGEGVPPARQQPPKVQGIAQGGRAPSDRNYTEAVGPLVKRMSEIGPFLVSAAGTPNRDVLEAMARTLTAVELPMRGLEVPAASRPAHNLLVSAVAAAQRAVAPDFTGSRVTQAQRALMLFEAAKVELASVD